MSAKWKWNRIPSLSVLAIKPDEQRLALDHGTIHALIWSPPGRFIVNTPSAQTVDLGCQYTLNVDAEGVGLVEVSVRLGSVRE